MNLTTVVGDLFEQSRAFNQSHPLLGAMATASLIFPLADITSQVLLRRDINWRKVRYTAGLSPLYGILAHGCVESGAVVGDYISDHPFMKAALGPNLLGNGFNAFFFVNNAVGEKTGYDLGKLTSHYYSLFQRNRKQGDQSTYLARIKSTITDNISWPEYAKSTIGTLTFWNAFQYVNYSYVSREMQTPTTLGVALCWMVLLSGWSFLGAKKVKDISIDVGTP